MSQQQGMKVEIQQVIKNIRELTNKTVRNGCTEAEAMSAARKIGDLMKVYNLTMDKVFLGESKCITGTIETGRQRRHPIDSCVVSIAEFCDCRVWFSWEKCYKVFGLEPDVNMAKYLYSIVWDAIETATIEYKQSTQYKLGLGIYDIPTSRKRLSISFQRGMSSRIYRRLHDMMLQRHYEEDEESPLVDIGGGGTSLVVVKRNKVETEFEKLNLHMRKAAHTERKIDHKAYAFGGVAGDKVNLNRPLAGKVVGYLQ